MSHCPLISSRIDAARRPVAFATELFSQQLWCWGRDILHPQGNLLVALGLERTPPPPRSDSPSLYTATPEAGTHVILRGFGVFFGVADLGGVFVRRYGFRPMLTPDPALAVPLWSVEDLPELIKIEESMLETATRLTQRLCGWIADWEDRTAQLVGMEARRAALAVWHKPPVVAAEEMADAWRWLAEELSARPDVFFPMRRSVPVACGEAA